MLQIPSKTVAAPDSILLPQGALGAILNDVKSAPLLVEANVGTHISTLMSV
jgi:hypothetical protein